MGAKRAVPGRSAPYDQLLATYQKNQGDRQSKRCMLYREVVLIVTNENFHRYPIPPRLWEAMSLIKQDEWKFGMCSSLEIPNEMDI